jgi:hypothetical protein
MQKEATPQLTPKDAHKVKMGVKKNMRAHAYKRDGNADPYIPANLGRNHPDYGMSMKDHETEKAARKAQKSS